MSGTGARTVASAVAALAVLVAVAFVVQASVLGRPGRQPLLVVEAVKRLGAYHSSHADETIAGHRLTAACSQRWVHKGHRATVAFSDGAVLSELAGHLVETGRLARAEFDLAGCPHPLAKWLGFELSSGAPLSVRPARLDGRPVLALVFATSHPELDVLVARQGGLPLALSVSGDGLQGTSELRYGTGGHRDPKRALTGTQR